MSLKLRLNAEIITKTCKVKKKEVSTNPQKNKYKSTKQIKKLRGRTLSNRPWKSYEDKLSLPSYQKSLQVKENK